MFNNYWSIMVSSRSFNCYKSLKCYLIPSYNNNKTFPKYVWYSFHPLSHDIIFNISHISLDVEQWRIYLSWSLSTICKMLIVVWLYILYHAYLSITFMCLHAPLIILTQESLNLNMTWICCFHRAKFSPSNFSFPIKSLFLDVVIILMYTFQSYYTTNMITS